ncbi:MAG TPA: tRNA (guanine(10)-N(2))-dimethyltransferase [Hadesarchaea archaeon]|nr:tRNA (guanine(10)-N(2))-dimethyltransferase [Hadesarchaea archaeon]
MGDGRGDQVADLSGSSCATVFYSTAQTRYRVNMELKFIVEGQTRLEVPASERFRTKAEDYAPSMTPVFYNPRMEFCRDISVSVAQVLADELGELLICDSLAGVGVRGVRYAKEVKGVSKVLINDGSSEAFELIKQNIGLNELAPLAHLQNEDANTLLWKNRGRFNFVDLDPFGSPAPFLDAACAALARRGMLAVTATDTAPLSGTHVRACVRRYGARPIRTEYCRELGLRILTGFCQRVAGKHDLALIPVLAHATLHYFRIYLYAQKGSQRADGVLKRQGYVSHCHACGRRILTYDMTPELPGICECGSRLSHAGPLWLGKLMDRTFLGKVTADLMRRNFKLKAGEIALLNRCAEEAEGPPMFYDTHKLARCVKTQPPKIAELISKLQKLGHFASRTHFSDTGFRTDAPVDGITRIFRR